MVSYTAIGGHFTSSRNKKNVYTDRGKNDLCYVANKIFTLCAIHSILVLAMYGGIVCMKTLTVFL